MDERSRELFEALRLETLALHARWKLYRSLYAEAPPEIDVLNLSGAGVFDMLQDMLFENLVLRLCRLTEPPSPWDNLSLGRLKAALEAQDPQFVSDALGERIEALMEKCERLRQVRNRRIAHVALRPAVREGVEPLARLTRSDVEQPIRMLAAALNAVAERYGLSRMFYGDLLVPLSEEGQKLVEVLRQGSRS